MYALHGRYVHTGLYALQYIHTGGAFIVQYSIYVYVYVAHYDTHLHGLTIFLLKVMCYMVCVMKAHTHIHTI